MLNTLNNHQISLVILQTPERDFTIRISGLEIYNENVRDLLNTKSGRNLKLHDDPEVVLIITFVRVKGNMRLNKFCLKTEIVILFVQKGTMVEKLVEETANNDQHLRHLISICEGKNYCVFT